MSQDSRVLSVAPAPGPWITPAAIAASLVALGGAALLCALVVEAGRDWHRLPWLQGPGSLAGVGIAVGSWPRSWALGWASSHCSYMISNGDGLFLQSR